VVESAAGMARVDAVVVAEAIAAYKYGVMLM
jgi:hypothetical protein